MGTGLRNLFCALTLIICFILQSSAASRSQQQQLPSAMVVGTVYCNTCFQQEFSKIHHSFPGASVEVKCDRIGENKLGFQKQVKTNKHGVFRFRLPLQLSREVKEIKTCSVKLVRGSQSICSMASSETSAEIVLRLKSRRHGVHVFSAGLLTFKPLKQPEACNHKLRPSVSVKYSVFSQKRVRPAFFFPPPIPFLPSPPNVGGIPLPPNPLQPPPSILPPLPFQPPPPSTLPPLPFQPSPPPFSIVPPLPSIPPLPNIPPLPFLVPVPPPPPPAFAFPPLPFPPIFPGPPPAASAQGTIK